MLDYFYEIDCPASTNLEEKNAPLKPFFLWHFGSVSVALCNLEK